MSKLIVRIFRSVIFRLSKNILKLKILIKSILNRTINKKDVKNELKRIGIEPYDRIIVHSSMSKIGVLSEGAKTFVEALKEYVTEDGTIIMPTHSANNMYDYLNDKNRPPFSVIDTPSRLGKITEYFRKQDKTYRSIHPTHSVAAWGKDAGEYVKNHHKSFRPFDKFSPYPEIIEDNFKTLAIGVDLNSTTVVRVADDLMSNFPFDPYTSDTFKVDCVDRDGSIISVETYSHRRDIRYYRDNMILFPYLKDLIKLDKFFSADIMLYNSKEVYEGIVRLAQKGITTYKADK